MTGLFLVFLCCAIQEWAYNGHGRWVGVPPPNNVIKLNTGEMGDE